MSDLFGGKSYWQRTLTAFCSTLLGAIVTIEAPKHISSVYIVALISAVCTIGSAILIDRLLVRRGEVQVMKPSQVFLNIFAASFIVEAVIVTYLSRFAESDGILFLLRPYFLSYDLGNSTLPTIDNLPSTLAQPQWRFSSYTWLEWYFSLMYFGFFFGLISALWSWIFMPLFDEWAWSDYVGLGGRLFFLLQATAVLMLLIALIFL